jgi:phage-related protein
MIFGYYYLDYKTITGFLTNILLIGDKIYNSMSTAVQSVEEFLPFSSYMKMPVLFNTIDSKYKKQELDTELEIREVNAVDAPTETEMSAGPAVNASQVVIEVNFD